MEEGLGLEVVRGAAWAWLLQGVGGRLSEQLELEGEGGDWKQGAGGWAAALGAVFVLGARTTLVWKEMGPIV